MPLHMPMDRSDNTVLSSLSEEVTLQSTGKKLGMFLRPLFQALATPSERQTPGEKPGGSTVARVPGAAMEPPGFSGGSCESLKKLVEQHRQLLFTEDSSMIGNSASSRTIH
jgi:hypothetical protein